MVFSDVELIAAIGEGVRAVGHRPSTGRVFDVVNLSLGGAGCAGIGNRLALGRFLRDLADLSERTNGVRLPSYVAAAGNDGAGREALPSSVAGPAWTMGRPPPGLSMPG